MDAAFDDIRGLARVERNGAEIWRKELATGEANMCHSLENMEHHHFKYAAHRLPGTYTFTSSARAPSVSASSPCRTET